jgi:hypothetical protein
MSRPIILDMNSDHAGSRFLLLPELSEPSVTSKQPVLRRYSLARLPALQMDPPVSGKGGA